MVVNVPERKFQLKNYRTMGDFSDFEDEVFDDFYNDGFEDVSNKKDTSFYNEDMEAFVENYDETSSIDVF